MTTTTATPVSEVEITAIDAIDAHGDRLVAWLRQRGAIGKLNAVGQAVVAAAFGISTRQLQKVTLRLNERGIAVISSVTPPLGIYLAETVDELGDYEAQLGSRLIGCAKRRRFVRRMRREKLAEFPVDPETGQQRFDWHE